MTSSEIRAEARKSLTGKWGKAALATLVFSVLTYLISFILNFVPFVGSLVATVISPVLSFGFLVTMMKLKRDTEISYVGFFSDGFSSFGKVWGVIGWTIVKLIVPVIIVVVSIIVMAIGIAMSAAGSSAGIILAVIGGIAYFVSLIYTIIKSYLYQLSLYIVIDNENMTAKEATQESEKLMNGHRWQFFWLQLTFIGWAILATFTCGIGLLWLLPYIQISSIAFYENLAGKSDTEVQKVEENTDTDPIQ